MAIPVATTVSISSSPSRISSSISTTTIDYSSSFCNNSTFFPKLHPRRIRSTLFSSIRAASSLSSSSSSSSSSSAAAVSEEPDNSSATNPSVLLRTPPPARAPAASDVRQARRSADWKAARAYKESQFLYEGRIEGFNGGGLLVRYSSLVGFLPYPELSSSHSCKEPNKSIHDIAKGLVGSLIPMKVYYFPIITSRVIRAEEEKRTLIFSEKEAVWTLYSTQINVGDIFQGMVAAVEDYGAFVHLRFPDGSYHLTGLVHVSEVSWDLVQDVRDILNEGDEVRVKIIKIDREKLRITLSIKQLEEDPLLETLDKDGSAGVECLDTNAGYNIEPLPGLETILQELLQEVGIIDVRISRQGFEKRVVSQDLQLWLSNAPAIDDQFTLLARAGRQVQEIQLTTSLDQDGIKLALQRVLERVP